MHFSVMRSGKKYQDAIETVYTLTIILFSPLAFTWKRIRQQTMSRVVFDGSFGVLALLGNRTGC